MYFTADIDNLRNWAREGRSPEEALPDSVLVSSSLNDLKSRGYELLHIVPQYQTWDDSGMPDGKEGPLFIFFEKDDTEPNPPQ